MKLVLAPLLSFLLCASACAEGSQPIAYWFSPGCPRKLKLATFEAAKAWRDQGGVNFVRTPDWTMADIRIWWNKAYELPGTLAFVKFHADGLGNHWADIRVNAAKADGWRWRLGDFGRIDKVCALSGAMMHELGHCANGRLRLGVPDLPAGIASERDQLANRDHWATMYGRAWPGKLSLERDDVLALQSALIGDHGALLKEDEGLSP